MAKAAAKAGSGAGAKGGSRVRRAAVAGSRRAASKGRSRSRPAAAYRTLAIDVRDGVARLALARPDVHNAFNEELIAEMTRALCELDSDEGVRAVCCSGTAGASARAPISTG